MCSVIGAGVGGRCCPLCARHTVCMLVYPEYAGQSYLRSCPPDSLPPDPGASDMVGGWGQNSCTFNSFFRSALSGIPSVSGGAKILRF